MAKNKSPFAVHVTDKDGNAVCVEPGKDFPAGVKIDNPYVTGDLVDESVTPFDADDEDDAAEGADSSESKPARGRGRAAQS
ncbi:hypothetical protein [Mycobacterium sp. TY813]|uniref:hypothetical protein n=1 Tax=Mycobacterium TaxID=1763 RepID=UPI0027412B6E|nr:hypothetical protein [Mycobacterium sp. TY813]MDP7729499.1 hypothetical protein [Mycobacterium sp. TY813]